MANALNPNDGYGDYTDEQLKGLPGAPTRGANGGYLYGWRPQAYQDVLGENDVAQQQQLTAFRGGTDGKIDAGDTGAVAQMTGQAPIQYQTPAQQWNAQGPPAPQAAPGGVPTAPMPGGGDLFNLLMQRATQGAAPNPNDPVLRSQADAYSANTERSKRNYLGDLAEKAGPTANLAGETRLANERAGQSNAGFEAELMGRETAARRDEIQQALQLYGSLMSDQQRMALEQQLAQLSSQTQLSLGSMSNQTQNRNLTNQNDQFLRELALREAGQNDTSALNWAALGL